MEKEIKVAVLTGNHYFESKPFEKLFNSLDNINSSIMDLNEFCDLDKSQRDSFQVIVFYHMYTKTPCEYNGSENQRQAILDIGNNGQGMLVLHHTLLAFKGWTEWFKIVGYKLRKFSYTSFQDVSYHIENKSHPITYKMNDYVLNDEVYETDEPDEQSDILITTENEYSTRTVAWTRTWKNSRVFCFQNGHYYGCYNDENYRTVLRNGILWLSNTDTED